jgi:twitching motility protein PilI
MMPSSDPSEGAAAAYVSFFLGDEEYAVPLARVAEVAAHEGLTNLPGAPPFLRGVIDVRGVPVAVIDLVRKFGRDTHQAPSRDRLLVVRADVPGSHGLIALVADRMSDVLELAPDDIEAVPPLSSGIRAEFLSGMARRDRHFVLLLDLDRVLSATEQEALTGHLASPAAESSGELATPAPRHEPDDTSEGRRLVAVRVAGLRCGIDAAWVREVTPWGDVTPVPGAPAALHGLFNLRGAVLPIVDLSAALGQASITPRERSAFLILDPPGDAERGAVGLAVEAILGMVDVGAGAIDAVPAFASPVPSGRLEGALLAGGTPLLVVNVSVVLSAITKDE